MPIATYRGESTLDELVGKLYTRLTPNQREAAKAELLKANPRLGDLSRLRSGTILAVPDLPRLRPKIRTTRQLEHPVTQVAGRLADDLEGYGKGLSGRFEQDRKDTGEQLELLAEERLQALLAKAQLEAQAKQVAEQLEGRLKASEERQQAFEAALEQALADLQAQRR